MEGWLGKKLGKPGSGARGGGLSQEFLVARNCRESPGIARHRQDQPMRPWWGGLPLGAAQDKGASDDCVWKGVQTAGRARRTLLSKFSTSCMGVAALVTLRYCTTDTPGRLALHR
jgi:hypothetical protein